jgi:hypothetical protein
MSDDMVKGSAVLLAFLLLSREVGGRVQAYVRTMKTMPDNFNLLGRGLLAPIAVEARPPLQVPVYRAYELVAPHHEPALCPPNLSLVLRRM